MIRRSILVVDDDADIRDSLRELLEEEGYHVATAANGREALDVLSSLERTPVMLLDLLMPVMSGWEVLETLRGRAEPVPVVVLSAAADSSKVLMSGAARFLPKPIQLEDLLGTLDSLSSE